MTAPKRVQMSRQHPWQDRANPAVICDRRGPLGNPFVITSRRERRRGPRWWFVSGWPGVRTYLPSLAVARQVAVEEFRGWAERETLNPYDWHQDWIEWHHALRAALAGIRDRDLACWCPLEDSCHCDVLLELANG